MFHNYFGRINQNKKSNSSARKTNDTITNITPDDLPPSTGEDIAIIFITTNDEEIYIIEIKGKYGDITSERLYYLSDEERIFIKDIKAACDGSQIETGISLQDLGNPSDIYISFMMCDWTKSTDRSNTIYQAGKTTKTTGAWLNEWNLYNKNENKNNNRVKNTESQGSRAWYKYDVDTTGNVGEYSAIALNSTGFPQISYFDNTNDALKFVNLTSTGWKIQTVDLGASRIIGRYSSIAMDSNDYPHICYYNESALDGNLKYANWTGSAWNIVVVDNGGVGGDVGMYADIVLDSNDYPHISYYDWVNEDLKYTNWTGSSWNTQTVDSTKDAGQYTSIDLDSNDYPHISYFYWDKDDLKYAYWTGSTWSTQTVESTGLSGHYTSIAIDSNDYPHISYYDFTSTKYDLKYANNTGSWNIVTVDAGGATGGYTSISLDSREFAQISYYYISSGDLKFANWSGSGWSIVTIDSPGNVGTYTSVAVDSNDILHISYYNFTGQDLKYATTASIPEFDMLILPVIIIMIFIAIFRSNKKHSKGVAHK
jgi:hypothetical protein